MMKNKMAVALACMIAGVFLSGYVGPWWAPAAFVVIFAALAGLDTKQGILCGVISLGLSWMGLAVFQSTKDETDVLEKTGRLLGNTSPVMLLLLTTFLGMITGFLAGWLGSALGALVRSQRQKSNA